MHGSGAVSRYMAWAKLHSQARFNLAVSGMVDYPIAELPVRIEDLEIGGTGPYGYPPLMDGWPARPRCARTAWSTHSGPPWPTSSP